jgi:hypothetical protein
MIIANVVHVIIVAMFQSGQEEQIFKDRNGKFNDVVNRQFKPFFHLKGKWFQPSTDTLEVGGFLYVYKTSSFIS